MIFCLSLAGTGRFAALFIFMCALLKFHRLANQGSPYTRFDLFSEFIFSKVRLNKRILFRLPPERAGLVYSFVSQLVCLTRPSTCCDLRFLGCARFLNKIARISRHEIPEPQCIRSKIKTSQMTDVDVREQRKAPILWRFWGFSV
jgi:hypothetical protein